MSYMNFVGQIPLFTMPCWFYQWPSHFRLFLAAIRLFLAFFLWPGFFRSPGRRHRPRLSAHMPHRPAPTKIPDLYAVIHSNETPHPVSIILQCLIDSIPSK